MGDMDYWKTSEGIMSLRDYFAGQALAGMETQNRLEESYDFFAKTSYKIADAMLRERDEKK